MQIVNSVVIVFGVILLGVILRRTGFFSSDFTAGMSRMTYWIGLPCLLFWRTSAARYDLAAAGSTFLVLLIATAAVIALGYAAALAMRLPAASTGAFVQACYRGNVAFIGLPVIAYAAAGREGAEGWATLAALAIAPIIPTYVLVSIVVLLAGRRKMDAAAARKMAIEFATNPLFLACLAGGIFAYCEWPLPEPVSRGVEAIGRMSEPMALLSIGGTLAAVGVKGRWTPALASAVIKVAAAPLAGLAAAQLLGLGHAETSVALIYLACPSAVAGFIMAGQLDADEALAASSVVTSTLLGMVSLGVVVGLT